MKIKINTATDSLEDMEAMAYFLLVRTGKIKPDLDDSKTETRTETHAVGDISHTVTESHSVPAGTTEHLRGPAYHTAMPVPPPPPPPPIASESDADLDVLSLARGNVINFPTPPPLAHMPGLMVPTPPVTLISPLPPAPPPPPALGVTNAGVADAAVGGTSPVAPQTPDANTAERDAAGLPWDARIHQKSRGKKKDLTWKLLKGIDPLMVQQVVKELVGGAQVLLPRGPTGVPLPPPPAPVSVPLAAGNVPAPPPPAVGGLSPYRSLLDKVIGYQTSGRLTKAQVDMICQNNGCPGITELGRMTHLVADVNAGIDALMGG